MTYRTITTQRRVIPDGKTLGDEGVTIIGMDDEGGGACWVDTGYDDAAKERTGRCGVAR